jgi:copper chaperone CopZ
MKSILIILAVVVSTNLNVLAQTDKSSKTIETVVFNVNTHCQSCKAKIEHHMTFEKGVKSVIADIETQTVTLSFRTDKNTVEGLKKALESLDYKVSLVQPEKKKSSSES